MKLSKLHPSKLSPLKSCLGFLFFFKLLDYKDRLDKKSHKQVNSQVNKIANKFIFKTSTFKKPC